MDVMKQVIEGLVDAQQYPQRDLYSMSIKAI
jgi:hypothetical protein